MFHTNLKRLSSISRGLNIEGCLPYQYLPMGCKWYNLVQVIDEPLSGDTFDKVMERVRDQNYDLIEQAVGIDIEKFLDQLTTIITNIKKDHVNLLVHVHQYTGTTKLHKILEERTGVKCILDETNFFETPMNYSREYPKIDGLISLSQCAGLECSPGSWIVPKYYLLFNVKERIIHNEPRYAINHIKKYLPPDFEYISSPILAVNELWNPDSTQDEVYLILDREANRVLNFVKENTKIFDETHDWRHAVNVAINSVQILDTRGVLYLALLHDVCDHKYPESIPRSELSKWIKENIYFEVDIDSMIDRVSFSKQNGDMTKVHPVLEAVRDGDRMEAIGEIGIFRCEEYGKMRGYKLPDHLVKHSHDKLLRLVPEGFIVNHTPEVMRRHKVLEDYVKQHTPLKEM